MAKRGRPRKYPEGTEFSNIQLELKNIKRLAKIGCLGQSYNDVVHIVLSFYEEHKLNKKKK